MMRIGVDVGGTFTDLVAWDGHSLQIVKLPSTPAQYEQAVIAALRCVEGADQAPELVHGSTVATNALLQRSGGRVAFLTTDGFRDMLLIGRQNRPKLYDLHVRRPAPITPPEHCFTVKERMGAHGQIITPLQTSEIDGLIEQMKSRGLRDLAVCLLFSFVNPIHEQMIGQHCAAAGISVSLSSEILPEFREYERASTTAINASLRPVVADYLRKLDEGLRENDAPVLQIMHSGGGTINAPDAAKYAARLVLSGPAGGVIGAAYVARIAGLQNCITYDMGGTSTDVALILDGKPQWTTSTTIDGLPIALPMFEIQTVGAGGGSIAFIDAGGALRVGPISAGAEPGPACYARGGSEPTVTDANLLLGRIVPEYFLGGKMKLDFEAARSAIARLASQIGKDLIPTALGIVRVAESNMAQAIRAVSSRRGHDPRGLALISFGGAGGLHACALAENLEIATVIIPPHCGVLSALGMLVAPPLVDASATILQHEKEMDDERLRTYLWELEARAVAGLRAPVHAIDYSADVRFRGQSHELLIEFNQPARWEIHRKFEEAYKRAYGKIPTGASPQIVTLRVRARGPSIDIAFPALGSAGQPAQLRNFIDDSGMTATVTAITRDGLASGRAHPGPLLMIEDHATSYVPAAWSAAATRDGIILLTRRN